MNGASYRLTSADRATLNTFPSHAPPQLVNDENLLMQIPDA